jgi:hypothetical protein
MAAGQTRRRTRLARIVTDGNNLTAFNECESPTPVNLVTETMIYFFNEQGLVAWNGDHLTIYATDGNSWQKLQ